MPSREYRLQREIQGRPLPKDRRSGDRHKAKRSDRPSNSGRSLSKWERRRIVAWDGEGANLDDGTHVYNLLANSDGVRIVNHGGLRTVEVFDFFIKYGDPKAINVIYGGSYDVNMLLVDLPVDKLRELWTTGMCYWGTYRIFYANRKKFTVQKFIRKPGNSGYTKLSFILWDVLGYFQATFVTACRKWLGDMEILDQIEAMKQERSVFSVDKISEIIEYNAQECRLLVQLCHALFEAMDTAGIILTRYDGAGSIAAALMRKNKVQNQMGKPSDVAALYAQFAYSGGRIEACQIGNYDG